MRNVIAAILVGIECVKVHSLFLLVAIVLLLWKVACNIIESMDGGSDNG